MGAAVTTTLADLIERTRRHLYTEVRDEIDRLAQGIDADDTTLTVDFGRAGVKDGAVLSIGLEELLVWSVSGATVTVERGFNGTTAAAHDSGDLIRVNPKHTDAAIAGALNDDLADLSTPANGLYGVGTVELTYQAGTHTYGLTGVSTAIGILEVSFDANDGTGRWPVLSPRDWRLGRAMETDDYSTGLALTLDVAAQPGRQLRVVYAKPFTALTALAHDVVVVGGLPATAVDIPPMGAAMRLTDGGEVARNFLHQGDTRRAGEVPAQARGASSRTLAARRRERIGAERSRLYRQYPAVTR